MAKQIGVISQRVIDLLDLSCSANTPIYLGEQNIQHMQSKHKFDYEIYGDDISNIISSPDYVSLQSDGSIEYIKEYAVDDDFVKVAVRVTTNGKYFARTLYSLSKKRVQDFITKGTLKRF